MIGVAGDTLVSTASGLRRAMQMWTDHAAPPLLGDGRSGDPVFAPGAGVERSGRRSVARLRTREGFELRATPDQGLFSEERGWVRLSELRSGEAVRVADRGGAFGTQGGAAEGHVLGWLVGRGHLTRDRAVLRFEGPERDELAPLLTAEVNAVIRPGRSRAHVPVGLVETRVGGASTVSSSRLREFALGCGMDRDVRHVPEAVWGGTRGLQAAFVQTLFEARAGLLPNGPRAGLHLTAPCRSLLVDVQLLLLNLSLYSRVAPPRARDAGASRPGHAAERTPRPGVHASRRDRAAAPGAVRVTKQGAAATPPDRDRLTVTGASARRFPQTIGFMGESKRREMADFVGSFSRRPYREHFIAHVDAVRAEGMDWVYGIRTQGGAGFVANGLLASVPPMAEGVGGQEGSAGLRAGG